ncbi:adenosine receptor A3-like [Pocillopora verrucosa]|uniref:adenosine receptor A3-like n=1 Tax=Pocillopora verrucosa TaxID=203993 RepID=UPI0033419DF1
MNVSMSEDLLVNSSGSKFFCPSAPQIIWDLERKVFIQLGIVISAVIGSFTALLNILVISAIKKTRELQRKSIILISSLAVADLLVGAVSAPFNMTVDALILRGTVSVGMICLIAKLTKFVSSSAYRASYYHVVLFSWEMYVAIVKPMKYKAIVTEKRLTRLAIIAWMTALTPSVLFLALEATAVSKMVPRVIFAIVQLLAFTLMVYFYSMVYIGIRKWNRSQFSHVNALIKARMESKTALTVFLLTIAILIAIVPLGVAHVLAQRSLFFREISVLRWAETFLLLNSIVNPALYFYRKRKYRKAALNLLSKPREIQPAVHVGLRKGRQRYSSAFVNVKELVHIERGQRLTRSQSWTADTHVVAGTPTVPREPVVAIINRRMSFPPLIRHENLREVILPLTRTFKVQIELTPTKK